MVSGVYLNTSKRLVDAFTPFYSLPPVTHIEPNRVGTAFLVDSPYFLSTHHNKPDSVIITSKTYHALQFQQQRWSPGLGEFIIPK